MVGVTRKERFLQIMKSIVNDIEKIEAKIHLIVLTGNYKYKDLQKKIGPLAVSKPNDIVKAGIAAGYNIVAYKQLKHGTLTILVNPTDLGFLPQCKILTSYPSQKLLYELWQSLPNLHVSEAEYTVDIFYPNPKMVRLYFRFIRRNVYVPYKSNMLLFADNRNLKDCQKNMTLYADSRMTPKKKMKIKKKKKKRFMIKIYERGNDEDKDDGWLYDQINRVRIEVTADYRTLNKHSLTNLSDFLESLKFKDIYRKRFYFKQFNASAKKLPKENGHYREKDRRGVGAAFYAELKRAKRMYKNPAQYSENVKGLNLFKKLIFSEIRAFDAQWSKRYAKYEKKYGS